MNLAENVPTQAYLGAAPQQVRANMKKLEENFVTCNSDLPKTKIY
jgi:hypothetical protein